MNIPYYRGMSSFAIWDLQSTIIIGGAGGLTFLLSWVCLTLLYKIYVILLVEKEDV